MEALGLGWVSTILTNYGLPGLFAIVMLKGIGLVQSLIEKRKQNGNTPPHEPHQRRWDDGKDRDGSRLTLRDIRDSIHAQNNEMNKAITSVAATVGEMRGEMRAKFQGVTDRLDKLERAKSK